MLSSSNAAVLVIIARQVGEQVERERVEAVLHRSPCHAKLVGGTRVRNPRRQQLVVVVAVHCTFVLQDTQHERDQRQAVLTLVLRIDATDFVEDGGESRDHVGHTCLKRSLDGGGTGGRRQ